MPYVLKILGRTLSHATLLRVVGAPDRMEYATRKWILAGVITDFARAVQTRNWPAMIAVETMGVESAEASTSILGWDIIIVNATPTRGSYCFGA